jgi:hypothetical protein
VCGELVIAVLNGRKSVLHNLKIKWVKENLVVLLAVVGDSGSSSTDGRWPAL